MSDFTTSFSLPSDEAVFFFETISSSVPAVTGRMNAEKRQKFIEVFNKMKNQVIANADPAAIKEYFAQKLEVNAASNPATVNIVVGN